MRAREVKEVQAIGGIEVHPLATLFPPMGDDDFRALIGDIREYGQREPIILHDGKIVDGVHRAKACAIIGIEPKAREWNGEGSLVAFVLSANLRRRHLSQSQKATVALDVLPLLEAEARERMSVGGKGVRINAQGSEPRRAADDAAKLVGVSPRYVQDAKVDMDAARALADVNALEARIVASEDEADESLWEQARRVVALLDGGMTQRQVAAGWINLRTGEPYSKKHVQNVAAVVAGYLDIHPRPRFRDAYNEVCHESGESKDNHRAKGTGENEWYTPAEYIEAARTVLGEIDLDPAGECAPSPGPRELARWRLFSGEGWTGRSGVADRDDERTRRTGNPARGFQGGEGKPLPEPRLRD